MNYEEFLKPENTVNETVTEVNNVEIVQENLTSEENLDVQKAVVEELAADKAELSQTNAELNRTNVELQAEIASLKKKIAEQNEALAKVGEVLTKNTEAKESNQVALLDRDLDVPDRFPGETRDQVLEAIKFARDKAEADGRVRCAQVLESVLQANEPSGNLVKKRAALEKFFNDNQNILSGSVIAELEKYGISHKKGDEYLLPSEIIKRTY